ncbi:MAG: response regulator [Candidatus Omnitrophota bacterium]|jgi:two-component system phosphate regulon response regulator PhoB
MKKVLIIEDDLDMARSLGEILQREGLEVVYASEGYQSVELAHEKKPDLVILDLVIPLGDGLWVLQKLREFPGTKDIPVVIITGSSDEKFMQRVKKEGVDAFLSKPFDVDRLLSTIDKLLREK